MSVAARNRRLAWKLALVGAGMFAFAVFLLPPLYDVICDVLGINNGSSLSTAQTESVQVDQSRQVTVEFVANTYQGTPLDFRAPSPSRFKVHPGELTEVTYTARNLSDQAVWVQAVHSIVPGLASKHVEVLQCFCFDKQRFEAGESRDLTFAFYISPELSPRHPTVSVSYTFFKLESPPEDQE